MHDRWSIFLDQFESKLLTLAHSIFSTEYCPTRSDISMLACLVVLQM